MPYNSATPKSSVRVLPGVGPERAAELARLGLRTVGDLLLYPPARHEDRRRLLPIRDLRLQEAATVRGRIVAAGTNYYKKRTKSVFEIVLDDGSARLHCRWWNLPFMEKRFQVGDEVMVYGKPRLLRPRTIDHPETEIVLAAAEHAPPGERFIHLDRIVPIYRLTEGLPQRVLRTLVYRALEKFSPLLTDPHPAITATTGGEQKPSFPGYAEAVRNLHFPAELADAEQARSRLALDEFVELQLSIRRRRRNLESQSQGLPCAGDNHLIRPFLRALGFSLIPAQTRVLREMRQDMGGRFPMRRLLQGDVGSGKTVVAACCALMAMESGYNVALMAPTEILAEQHEATFRQWFGPLGLNVELQTGSRKTLEPGASVHRSGHSAPATLFIGTHALLTEGFQMERLGLVIIDEQHKFGVVQRETLLRKGCYPHLLVMTATPIPRTLGLTVYGDLDLSVIDALPPGRGRVRTFVRAPDELPRVLDFVNEKVRQGRQAYVVYPRIEEGDPVTGIKAVATEYERLRSVFAPERVGLLHGQLRSAEKAAVMDAFRRAEVKVLIATSVIEVGVDIPNATVMLIENADQFGLAQLHQLRGRIGRGSEESYCILVASQKTREAGQRLQALAETTDGFAIAEADLKLRGPGELLGQEQSGLPSLTFGDLVRDGELIEYAKTLVSNS